MASRQKPARILSIPVDRVAIECEVLVPDGASGLVMIVHDNGRTRSDYRPLAAQFQQDGLGTVLIDLVARTEAPRWAMYRDNASLHAERIVRAVEGLARFPELRELPLGLFGAGRGSAGVLLAAPRLRNVRAVVAGEGRPDLAGNLFLVRAPTLLLVPGNDLAMVEINERGLSDLNGEQHRVGIVSGVSRLFEAGKGFDEMSRRARAWFHHYLAAPEASAQPVEVWTAPPR